MTIDAETRELLEHCAAEAPDYTSTQFDTLRHLLAPLYNTFQPTIVAHPATAQPPTAVTRRAA